MAYEKERAFIAEEKAKLVSYEDNELLFRRTLIRNWPAEPDAIIESTLSYLYTYGSAANLTASQGVTAPKANRLEYFGTWRVVSNEKTSQDNEAQWPGLTGIVQTLRYGFAQALSWDEARVVNNVVLPGNDSVVTGIDDTVSDSPNDVIVVEFVNLDPAYTRAMVGAGILSSFTVTDPGIRGNTTGYTGDWHLISTTIGESPLEDGSGVIRVVLARPQYTLNAYESYLSNFYGATQSDDVHYLWNVPRGIAQTILDDWKATRRSASASLNSDDTVNLVLRAFDPGASPVSLAADTGRINCSATEVVYYYWGVTNPDASAYDIATLYAALGAGYLGITYNKSVSFNRNDATFDVVITKRTVTARAPYTAWKVHESVMEEREETVKFGQVTRPAIEEPDLGEVSVLNININDDCSIDSVQTIIRSTENNEIVSWASIKGTRYEGTYQNWDGGDAAAMLLDFINTAGFVLANYDVRTGFTRNEDGTYNGSFSAAPHHFAYSAGTPAYEGFTYWNMDLLRYSEKDENDPETVEYYMPEYSLYAVEYYNSDTYTEAEVHQQIRGLLTYGRGAEGSVSISGDYYRLHMLIGKIREVSPGVYREATTGIGTLVGGNPSGATGPVTGLGEAGQQPYVEAPPIVAS